MTHGALRVGDDRNDRNDRSDTNDTCEDHHVERVHIGQEDLRITRLEPQGRAGHFADAVASMTIEVGPAPTVQVPA